MLDRGVGFVSDDRSLEGLIPEFGAAENLVLGWQRAPEYRCGPFLDRRKLGLLARKKIEEFKVVTASAELPVARLSVGKTQRVILAREFLHARGAIFIFVLLEAVAIHAQVVCVSIPRHFFLILPYVASLVLLAGHSGRARSHQPEALGVPYSRE